MKFLSCTLSTRLTWESKVAPARVVFQEEIMSITTTAMAWTGLRVASAAVAKMRAARTLVLQVESVKYTRIMIRTGTHTHPHKHTMLATHDRG